MYNENSYPQNIEDKFLERAEENDEEWKYARKSKEELVNEVQRKLSGIFTNYDFNPDTIIYKGSYYIFQDNVKDVIVYYNANAETVVGIYTGFNEK